MQSLSPRAGKEGQQKKSEKVPVLVGLYVSEHHQACCLGLVKKQVVGTPPLEFPIQ